MTDALLDQPTTTPAPETSSAAPSSAPATSTTSTAVSTPAVAERPTTIRDLAKTLADLDAKSGAAPPTTAISAQPGAATTAQASDPTKASGVPSATPGPIPFDVHSRALENARSKALEGYRQQYGWAEKIPQATLQEFGALAQRMSSDPIGFLNEFTAQIANHPTYGPQLRSSAGRTLAAPPSGRPEPDVQVVNAQGQVIEMTYSAKRLAEVQEWDWNQREAKLNQTLAPLQQERAQRLQEAEIATFQRDVRTEADKGLSRIDTILDGRSQELGPHVSAIMQADPTIDPIDAALQVRASVIAPRAQAQAQAAVLDTQLKKAHGNTANGSGAVATPMRPKSRADLAALLQQLEG